MFAIVPVLFSSLALAAAAKAPAPFAHPLNGEGRATSGFGYRVDPFTGAKAFHSGLDIAAAQGTPVFAPKAGRIEAAGFDGPYGNRIQIDHGDAIRTVYGQLSRIDVKPGDQVAQGQQIGTVGSSGRSTGPHLHFEVWEGEAAADPNPLIAWRSRGAVVPE